MGMSIMIGFLPVLVAWLVLFGFLLLGYTSNEALGLLLSPVIIIPCIVFAIWRTWIAHKKLSKIIGEAYIKFTKIMEEYYNKNE